MLVYKHVVGSNVIARHGAYDFCAWHVRGKVLAARHFFPGSNGYTMEWLRQAKQRVFGVTGETSGSSKASAAPMPASTTQRVDNISTEVRMLGRQESNFPHIFRDGGGGGTVGGLNLIIFADGSYTRGPPPTDNREIVSFISNSVAVIGSTIKTVTDTGTMERGPDQAIPFYESDGEVPMNTGVWPNQNIAPILDGSSGVTFPAVIDRPRFAAQKDPLLYNTPVEIRIQNGRPHVTRPAKSLFMQDEPLFGTFAAFPGSDGFLYLFACVSKTDKPQSNGLKLARVLPQAWADRTQYEYWDGQQFGLLMPEMDDGGVANVFHYSQEAFGKHYGPGTGDVFWSNLYGQYILLFQNAAAAFDNSGKFLLHPGCIQRCRG